MALPGNTVIASVTSKGKMRSYWRGGLEPNMTDVLIKRRALDTCTGRTQCEDEGRDQGNVSTSQEMLQIASKPPESLPGGASSKESTCNARDLRDASLIHGSGRSPGGGPSDPFQYSCLENLMGREACQATVHRVTKSQT